MSTLPITSRSGFLSNQIYGSVGHVQREAHRSVNWGPYIESDPSIMEGRPVLRDSQVPVDFLLGLLAAGWSETDVLTNYPHLTRDHLRAVFAFAAESVRAMRRPPQADREPASSPWNPGAAPPSPEVVQPATRDVRRSGPVRREPPAPSTH